jgi:DNA-binding Lrp family transcriptional regulator
VKTYRGINAYVFVSGAHAADLKRLRSVRPGKGIRAFAILSGPHDAIVAVGVDRLKELEAIVLRLRGDASPDTETALGIAPSAVIPMSPNLPPVVAFVRITVEAGRARDVLRSVQELPATVGACMVAGSFDILLEVGGKTFAEVSGVLLEDLQRIGGIASTVTSFAVEIVHATQRWRTRG